MPGLYKTHPPGGFPSCRFLRVVKPHDMGERNSGDNPGPGDNPASAENPGICGEPRHLWRTLAPAENAGGPEEAMSWISTTPISSKESPTPCPRHRAHLRSPP